MRILPSEWGKGGVAFLTKEEKNLLTFDFMMTKDVIIVDGIIIKNRYGFDGVKYEGNFGICRCCNAPIKERQLFYSSVVGCLC